MSAHVIHKQPNLPLPPLQLTGKSAPERLLARYDRAVVGAEAWLRVSLVDLSSSMALQSYVATKTPGSNWKREAEVEELELSGLRASRIAWAGRWDNRDYICESVAVRKGEKVYVITGSFPAADAAAREQVRQAVASAAWQ